MSLLARLRERKGGKRGRFARELRALYLDARRAATQLRRHGEHVPYPSLGIELRRLAEQVERSSATLAEELRAIAGNVDPADPVAPREGRNHWERLTLELAALEALRRRSTELALHWDVDFPATSTTLAELSRATGGMCGVLRAMLARSDPHAA